MNGNVPNDGFRIPKKSNATSGSSFQKGNNYRKPGKKQSKDVTMPKRGSFPPRGGKSNRAWRKGKKFNDVSEDTSRWTSDSFFPKMGKDNSRKMGIICNKRGLQAGVFTKTSFSGNKVHSKTNNKNSDLLKAEINSLI